MSEEGFLRRWSRRKAQGQDAAESAPPARDTLAPEARDNLAPADRTATGLAGNRPSGQGPGAALDVASFPRAGDVGFASVAQTAPHPPVAPPAQRAPARELPTLDDVARLEPDSDFSAFVSKGVDKTVQRMAMKKLFADPHFNVMDGLDIYIDDYNKSDPVPAAMLASLQHAKSVFAKFLEDDKAQGQGGPGPGPGQPATNPDPDPPPPDHA
jgi:hypothetical protein